MNELNGKTLLQTQPEVTTPPDTPPEPPIEQTRVGWKSKKHLSFAFIGLTGIVIVGVWYFASRNPETPIKPTPTTPPVAVQLPPDDVVNQASRNIQDQEVGLTVLRRNFILRQATQKAKDERTEIQVQLLKQLSAQNKQLHRLLSQPGQLSGDAKTIAQLRSQVLDIKATVEALQLSSGITQTPIQPQKPNLSEITNSVDQLLNRLQP